MTTIDSIDVGIYTIPTDSPEGDGTFAWTSTTMTLVRISGGGETGIGFTYGAAECGTVIRSTLAPLIADRDIMDLPALWESMVRAVRNSGRQGAIGYAISAVDAALWDLKARILGLPLHRLLGAIRADIPVYASGGFTTYDEAQLGEQLDQWLSVGSTRVKIKIGESWGTRVDRDLDRMAQTRRRIGDDVQLFIDANGGYSAKQAIRVMNQAADLDVRWFEEPVSSDNLTGLAQVRAAVDADVAAGEYGYDIFTFRRLCDARAVDCLQADVSRCGGITEWLRVAAVAASFGLELSGHCAPNLHVQVAAAIPNLRHLEWFHDHDRIEKRFFEGALEPHNGVAALTEAAGNGLTLRAADAEMYRIA
ncbi:MAG TPA: enolase C-terminal domain-like protein [Mycobacterium sp.]|nr:enolase C-terminal domain-like protein [Mycobacterium sp.]